MFKQRKIKIFIVIFFILCLVLLKVLQYYRLYLRLYNFKHQIGTEMQNYDYPNGKFGVDAKCLEDFVPEAGGTPMRSIIVSSWRSGSTFLGDLINSVPGNYYHFEPLLPYGTVQIRWPPNDTQPLRDIKNLLNCNYSGVNKFFQSNKINKFMFGYNWRVWNACNKTMEICYHPKFLGQICKLFPLQSMKLVRMRLKVAQQLLDDSR